MTEQPEEHTNSPIMEMIGGEIESSGDGVSVMAVTLEEKHMNPGGVVHGGVLTTLMDEATGHAIITLRGFGVMAETPHSTVDMNVTFLAPARVGDEIVCEARTLRLGRTHAFAVAEVRKRGSCDVIAMGRFTYAILQKRPG